MSPGGAKFLLAVGMLIPAVLIIAGVGGVGVARMAQRTNFLYDHSFAVSQHSADVVAATDAVHETALYQIAVDDPLLSARTTTGPRSASRCWLAVR